IIGWSHEYFFRHGLIIAHWPQRIIEFLLRYGIVSFLSRKWYDVVMTGPEGGTPNLDLVEALAAAGMAAGPVENSRRLIPLVTETEGQVLEFYSSQAGSRLLALPRQGVDHEIHDDLSR